MFRTTVFYDNFADHLSSPWKFYAAIGVSLMVMAILIFILPELIAYLIASFLFFVGIMFLGIGLNLKNFRKYYHQWVNDYWE